ASPGSRSASAFYRPSPDCREFVRRHKHGANKSHTMHSSAVSIASTVSWSSLMPTARKLSTLCLLMLALSSPLHAESRCTTFSKAIVCSAQSLSIDSGSEAPRKVVFQVPAGAAPAGGWPAVLLFHGALMRSNGFSYHVDLPFGGYYQGKLVQALLDNGFAVIAPNAMSSSESWQTNSAEYADN